MDTTMDLTIERGTAWVLFAYDLGLSIDLDRAERALAGAGSVGRREAAPRTPTPPKYFQFSPAPLRVSRAGGPGAVGGRATSGTVEAVLYDFGAVSIAYAIPITGRVEGLIELAQALYDNAALLADSRQWAEWLLRELGDAVRQPDLSDFVEDYVVYQVVEHDRKGRVQEVVQAGRESVARLLRAERRGLHAQQVEDAFACVLSYGRDDVAVIDWNAALLIDDDPEDATAALEFANVELLEMRHLDDRLDKALEKTYQATQQWSGWWRRGGFGRGRELERVAELQVESAILFEGVNNAIKLLGDQYLARAYRLGATRFHLAEWDANILRKLATLESIYQKMSDRRTNRRMEALEWVIIVLIGFEIVWSLIGKG